MFVSVNISIKVKLNMAGVVMMPFGVVYSLFGKMLSLLGNALKIALFFVNTL